MNPAHPARTPVPFALLVGAALLSSGCAEELGPVPMPVARVHGNIRQGDRPVSGGWIEFIPANGTIGNLRSARLQPDGSFDADGVAVGENAIRLVEARLGSAPLPPIFGTFQSPIRRRVTEGSSTRLSIDLAEEALRFQQFLNRATAGAPPVEGEGP
jgi:hypothetical protein